MFAEGVPFGAFRKPPVAELPVSLGAIILELESSPEPALLSQPCHHVAKLVLVTDESDDGAEQLLQSLPIRLLVFGIRIRFLLWLALRRAVAIALRGLGLVLINFYAAADVITVLLTLRAAVGVIALCVGGFHLDV